MYMGPYRDDAAAHNVIPAASFPIIIMLCYILYPDTSMIALIVSFPFFLLMVGLLAFTKIKKWQYYVGWRLGVLAVLLDISMVFMTFIISRLYDNAIASILLLFFLVVTIFLGHRFANRIRIEMQSPSTWIGKMIVALGLLGSGVGSLIGYWSANLFGFQIVMPILYFTLLIVIAIVHAYFHSVAFKGETDW
ncbi:hypothetical protein [Salirhabdus sp. Marseille-P4669]|uniref:hypothetical protein n=1 Tax=Salirhabdus sp. Marseille-P4669 TaxID=2042310 RepID=UPI000C7D9002|nr:hypothetical protein [Salirhabdus sp. Marseille-P4669]